MGRLLLVGQRYHNVRLMAIQRHLAGRGFEVTISPPEDALGLLQWQADLPPAERYTGVLLGSLPDAQPDQVDFVWDISRIASEQGLTIARLQLGDNDHLPEILPDDDVVIVGKDLARSVDQLVARFSRQKRPLTFAEARQAYLDRRHWQSLHTLSAYERALDLFFTFLGDRHTDYALRVRQRCDGRVEDFRLEELDSSDDGLLRDFAMWLAAPSTDKTEDKRPYSRATIELRLAGVVDWFQFLASADYLPIRFPLDNVVDKARHAENPTLPEKELPELPEHLVDLLHYYETIEMPTHLRRADADPERVRSWELTRLRNNALVQSLLETGGRVSELLGLDTDDFLSTEPAEDGMIRIRVDGKGGHSYYLEFASSAPPIRRYLTARAANSDTGQEPLFVSHDARYAGRRMSRVIAWRVVSRAAHALRLGTITPQHLRHWRAVTLLEEGHSLEDIQERLGHRSVGTTRAYYGRYEGSRDPEDEGE